MISERPLSPDAAPTVAGNLLGTRRGILAHGLVYIFVLVPFAALGLAIPLAWGRGLAIHDVAIGASLYVLTMLGATVGYHRYFTHRAFKAKRPLRIVLAILGSMAVQGPILHWVADHRRHHAYADAPGDPHSPWVFGTSPAALVRGAWHAHLGWILDRSLSNQRRFVPDLLADPDIRLIHRLFAPITVVVMLLPAAIGGLITGSLVGAFWAFFWGSLVRIGLQHHVSWSVNSICHIFGARPYAARDRSTNLWPLAILSMGESWHNLHHADPTSARHGVGAWQIDISARAIWLCEKAGWAYDVRWPNAARIARLQKQP
jgi:stearoyl-CoA desaturase (delta-9 desaturase)